MEIKTIAISINAAWNIVNFRVGLIKGLQQAGYRVVAITPNDRHVDRLRSLGIEHVPIAIDTRGTSPVRDLRLFADYWLLLRRLRPDVFLGYTVKPNVFGSLAANLCGTPVINNIAGLGETFLNRSAVGKLVRILYRLSLRRSKVVFFQNPDDRALFVSRGFVDAKIARLLPGSGVDLAHFTPRPDAGPVRPGHFSFLLVARLLWAKGIGDYVAAARLVRQQIPTAAFSLLGLVQEGRDAIDRSTLRQWAEEGTVDVLDGTDDVRPFIATSDCVVLPSYYPEGTPRALLEAAAMGKPLIASDMPGCRDVVADGVNGYLCPPHDPEALAAAMLRLIELAPPQRDAMARNSRQLAETRFDEKLVTAAYLDALGEIAAAQSALR